MAVATSMSAGRRRLVYGANVAFTVVLALAVVAIALWAAGQYGGRADLTSSRVNSLSSRTTGLLRGLDQDVTITGLYAVLSEYQQFAQKRQDGVRDLLDLYESFGRGKVATLMIDPMKEQAKVTALLQRLREKSAYQDEAKPHSEALEKFPALNAAVKQLAESDYDQFKAFADTDARLLRVREYVIVAKNLARVAAEAQAVTEDVEELLSDEIPRYGRAVSEVRDYLGRVRTYLQDGLGWMSGDGQTLPGLPVEVRTFFAGAQERYQPVVTDIEALTKETEDLERVKLEEVYETLIRWSSSPAILVETEAEARVLSLADVWPSRMGGGPAPADGDTREFAGEQAVSSAILQLTQKEKTAIIFTHFGGPSPIHPDFSQMNRMTMMQQMPRAPYQALNGLLLKNNFVTEDWDVAKQNEPPAVEDAARIIYVVYPPAPPPQPDPMRPSPQAGITPQQKQAILDAVETGGMAIFLTGWSQPTARFAMSGPPYAFGDHLKSTWGVEVRERHLALQFAEIPQNPEGLKGPANRNALIMSTDALRFTDHDITRPLQAMQGAFYAVAPLALVSDDEKPVGVTTDVLVETKSTEDVWAVSDINRLQQDVQRRFGTQRYDGDVAAPFPVAVAASDEEGHKVVVFASERFAADDIAQSQGFMLTGKGLQAYLNYPANTDLFINALHWLTGEADRIAVGPRTADVPRLDKLTEGGTVVFCRVFLVGIWPGLALCAGAIVWLLRRR